MRNKQVVFSNIHDGKADFSADFSMLFPKMTLLLSKAYKVEFTLNDNQRFRQYIWAADNGRTSGWLCKLEHCIPQGRNIIPEHILLSQTMGGIMHFWLDDSAVNVDTFIDANNYTFSLTDSMVGIGGWEENYVNECKTEGLKPLDTTEFVTFALEANGNTTFYNHKTKEVFIYLHDDYSPFKVTPQNGHPSCTIYKYDKVKTFADYVECLADQWLELLDLKQ